MFCQHVNLCEVRINTMRAHRGPDSFITEGRMGRLDREHEENLIALRK